MKEGSVDELWQARKYILFPWMKRGETKREEATKLNILKNGKEKRKKKKQTLKFHWQKERKGWMKEGTMDELWQARNYIIIPLGEKRGKKKRRKNNKI
jgi:hypothetical protein